MAYLSPASKQALSAAVAAIERTSSVEVVIAMQPASVPLALPCALSALLFATVGLAFLLFSPFPFSHGAIVVDSALSGAFGAVCAFRFPGLRRLFTPPSVSVRSVYTAACAEFLARGVTATRGRTGLLVYVSQIERRAAIIADIGIKSALGSVGEAFARQVERIAERVRQSEDGVALAAEVEALAPLLAQVLPRGSDDVNELADTICEG